MRNVPAFPALLLVLLMAAAEAGAQSSNGTYTVTGDLMASAGGRIGGGNPMQATTLLGLPAGGRATNSTYTLVGGLGTMLQAATQPVVVPTTVTGTVDDPAATVRVNGITASLVGTTFSALVPLALGPNALTATATDLLGNQASATITVHVDLPPAQKDPHGTLLVTGTVNEVGAVVSVNGVSASMSAGVFSATVGITTGYNTLTATAIDLAGNTASASVRVFVPLPASRPAMPTVGTQGPTIPRVTTTSSITIGGTKTPGTSIWINGVQVVPADDATTWTATLTLVEGDNDLVIVARDAAGTPSAEVRRTIILDNAPPIVTCAPPAKTNFNPYALTGQVDDSDTQVAINGLIAQRTGRDFTATLPLTLGPNTLSLTATSPNGLVTTVTYPITLGTVPAITAVAPADGAKAYAGAAVAITVTASDAESDAIQYQILVDGAPIAGWGASGSTTWTTAAPDSGIRTLTVRARDDYGGADEESAEFLVIRPPVQHP